MGLLDMKGVTELKEAYRRWVDEALDKQDLRRKPRWTETIAVESENFVKKRNGSVFRWKRGSFHRVEYHRRFKSLGEKKI